MRAPSRTTTAALALASLLGALLLGWFVAGWRDVRAQQREVRAVPAHEAERRGAELAGALRAELGRVVARESERPYFHYQNLFHDPRAGGNRAVAPSPLAGRPEEPIVLGYFQLDAAGAATTPTVNDEEPALSEPTRLAANRSFRAEVARSLAGPLAPPARPVAVAVAEPPRPVEYEWVSERVTVPAPAAVPVTAPAAAAAPAKSGAQQVQFDPETYSQNRDSIAVYREQQQRVSPPPQQRVSPPQQRAVPPPQRAQPPPQRAVPQPPQRAQPQPPQQRVSPQQQRAVPPSAPAPRVEPPPATTTTTVVRKRRRKKPPAAPQPPAAAPITITVSPLEWSTHAFAGSPVLVATRHVDTPDGTLAQGFVVDRGELAAWIDAHTDDTVARLAPGDVPGALAVAPGWHLEVAPSPETLVQAGVAAGAIATKFRWRFAGAVAAAALAAAFVVWLVSRAERLAQERSQFAAAAAHELRTPLAGLQLYGDMLADDLGDPKKLRDYARRMSEEAARLGRVVSNVLGFSQLERGNLAIDVREASLADALRELAARSEPALDRAGATLALDVPPDLHARFDRDALARIVGNLLDNAEKYSRGSADRTIDLTARALPGGAIEIAVTDHGTGVPAGARSRLFRPFTRGVTTDGPAGLGLGLALSRSLARSMGGDLEHRPPTSASANPAAGTGTTFVLRLPGLST